LGWVEEIGQTDNSGLTLTTGFFPETFSRGHHYFNLKIANAIPNPNSEPNPNPKLLI